MALIKCPECGKKISDKSAVCVHCGYPVKEHLAKFEADDNMTGLSEKESGGNTSTDSSAPHKLSDGKQMIIVFGIIAIIVACIFLTMTCEDKKSISDGVYQLGVNALSIVDGYIDGTIDKQEAEKKLNDIKTSINIEKSKNNGKKDYLIAIDTDRVTSSVSLSRFGINSMSDVINDRNKLAGDLGKKKR